MSNKQLSPSTPDVIDSPRKTRPKTVEQIMELIGMLPYDQQVVLYEDFKTHLDILTTDRINAAQQEIDTLKLRREGLNGQG